MMENKKAAICSGLFFIVMIGLFLAGYFIELAEGQDLYTVFSTLTAGYCIAYWTSRFYKWLSKDVGDEK